MEVVADKVEYILFQNLKFPQMSQISDLLIELGFQTKQWTVQFQTVTKLRQANKHYSTVFINQMLGKYYKDIVGQVENLRSNNSKEALTLLSEIFLTQDLSKLTGEVIRPIISILFAKSVNEKSFLKNQALKAINAIPSSWNLNILEELMILTKSANGNISELAIKTMNLLLQKNNINMVNPNFLKNLSQNINGKRSVVQKQAKQIFNNLKRRMGQDNLQSIIDNTTELEEQQSNTLKRQLKKDVDNNSKSNSHSFKDFMKMKKNQPVEHVEQTI